MSKRSQWRAELQTQIFAVQAAKGPEWRRRVRELKKRMMAVTGKGKATR